MPDENQKISARIRTFADDLDAHRQSRDGSVDPEPQKKSVAVASVKTDLPKIPTPKTHSEPVIPKPHPIEHFEVKAVEIPEKPKHIPAFHELQKQVSRIKSEPSQKVKSDGSSEIIRTNIGFDATVITDTKKNRQNFIGEISKSLSAWFKNITKPKKKKTPTYSIPEANHRKGVIQKATTKTGSIFTADSETLKEQIRRRQKQELVEQEEPETRWSPFTETGYNLLPSPNSIQNIKVEFKKQSAPSAEANYTATYKQGIPLKPIENNGAEELITARKSLDDTIAFSEVKFETKEPEPQPIIVPTPVPKPEPEPEQIEELPEPEVDEVEEQPIPEITKRRHEKPFLLERFDTNTLTVIILVTIISLVILVFVSKILIDSIMGPADSNLQKSFKLETLINGNSIETITVTTDNVSNLTAVLNNSFSLEREGLTELAFVTAVGDEIAPSFIFDLLNLSASAAMKQSLTSARFLIEDSKKTMLLKFVDDTTVRGSFLNWENSMSDDFVKIFNLPTNITSSFVDDKVIGYDIRVLKSNENTILIYCIVNENTALITQDKLTLEKILSSKFTK